MRVRASAAKIAPIQVGIRQNLGIAMRESCSGIIGWQVQARVTISLHSAQLLLFVIAFRHLNVFVIDDARVKTFPRRVAIIRISFIALFVRIDEIEGQQIQRVQRQSKDVIDRNILGRGNSFHIQRFDHITQR